MRWDYPPLDINPVFPGLGVTIILILILIIILNFEFQKLNLKLSIELANDKSIIYYKKEKKTIQV